MNGARSIRYGACSNETGKLANIIVIDRNYFDLLAQGGRKNAQAEVEQLCFVVAQHSRVKMDRWVRPGRNCRHGASSVHSSRPSIMVRLSIT